MTIRARRLCWPTIVLMVASLASCSSSNDDAAPVETTAPAESTYCTDLAELTTVIDDGGAESRYNQLLQQIVDEGPPEHADAWSLMLTLSVEPFTYENFNPALDSLDEIGADLEATCPRLGRFIVDDDGRVRSFPLKDFDGSSD